MSNPMRGEADLGEHRLVVNFNGWCSLEAAMGMKVPDLIAMMNTGIGFGFKELRTFVRVFLDKQMTDAEVGELIGALGMVDVPELDAKGAPKLDGRGKAKVRQTWVAAEALGKAVDRFFSPAKENGANPPKAA